jgi:hypothetical protein
MDPDSLLEPHLFWFQLIGLKLIYTGSWQDKLLKCLSITLLSILIVDLSVGFYFAIFSEKSLDEFVETIAPLFSTIDAAIKIVTLLFFLVPGRFERSVF